MTVGDALFSIQELLQSVEGKPILSLLVNLLVVANMWMLMFYGSRHGKRVMRFLTLDVENDQIEIIDMSEDTLTQRMPITVEDVKWYLSEVKKRNPKALKGINKIILCNRPKDMHPNILGSYSPNDPLGTVIRLYTVSFFPFSKLFTLDFSDIGEYKLAFTPEQARRMLLFTLGHEIGHNVEFRRSGRLFGDDVEDFCDEFSERLGIVIDPERSKQGKLFHIEDLVEEMV